MTDRAPRLDRARAARAVAELIAAFGEDPARPGLARTPERVADAAGELLGGIGLDPVPALREGRFPLPSGTSLPWATIDGAGDADAGAGGGAVEGAASGDAPDAPDAPVMVRGATFRSMCEHHLLPFTGVVHLAYEPSTHLVGLGRLYDLIETVTTRLTLQERVGDELVDALMAGLDARGAVAVVEASHGCVGLRGGRNERGDTVTVAGRGTLAHAAGRAEVMALLCGAGPRGAAVPASSR